MLSKNILDLTTRQTKLLFALIKEYCEAGETCGSKELKEKYGFDFSSATIRNELVSLRDMGYLYQPFINSSSSPTEKAFKLFVNQLIAGLGNSNKQQQELRNQIVDLQNRQEMMSKEIARLVATQTDTFSFAISENSDSTSGMKHLFESNPDNQPVSEILDFIDNLDKYKHHLLTDQTTPNVKGKKGKQIKTIFGSDFGTDSLENNVLPLGKGYALVATEIMLNNEKTMIGIISPTHLLANIKKLQTIEAFAEIFQKNNENNGDKNQN